ncbi:Carboxylesterase 5A [Mactra antiquata]
MAFNHFLFIFLMTMYVTSSFSFLIPDGIQKVKTKYGDIVGFIDQVKFDNHTNQVRKFLGIPYAEPPIRNLRFKKSIMKNSMPSPFMALTDGPQCLQDNVGNRSMTEDCLFLNIVTPIDSNTGRTPKPVMIWVHGGGFIAGSADRYPSDVISAFNDVIVVTLNYRLGALGFFSTHDDNAKGNYGLWDQHLAFRWVYENIGDFGGNQNNITIFGESAGSSSVIYQMMYSGNEGIFKRVIAESGTLAGWGVGNFDSNYRESLEFGRLLGCNGNNHTMIVECLRKQTESDIASAAIQILKARPSVLNDTDPIWVPVFDDEFVSSKPNTILNSLKNERNGEKYHSFKSFDLLIGANNFDGLVYFLALLPYFKNTTGPKYDVFGEHLYDFVIPRSVEAALGEKPSPLALQLAKSEYTDWNDTNDIKKKLLIASQVYTDYALNAPTVQTAAAHVNIDTSTYVYQFARAAPPAITYGLPKRFEGKHICNHGDDLAYVFGFKPNPYANFHDIKPEEINLSKAVMTMWTNFAKSGNPNYPVSLQPLYDVTWPEYDGTDEKYLVIDENMTPSSVKQRLAARAVEFWNNVLPAVQTYSKARQ